MAPNTFALFVATGLLGSTTGSTAARAAKDSSREPFGKSWFTRVGRIKLALSIRDRGTDASTAGKTQNYSKKVEDDETQLIPLKIPSPLKPAKGFLLSFVPLIAELIITV